MTIKNLADATVAQLMNKDVFLVKESDAIIDVIRQMGDKRLSSAIVDRESETDAYGILTRKDIVIEASENLESLATLKVRDLATKPAISIQPNIRADLAIRLMRLAGVRRLAVIDSGKLLGVLSNSDLFRAITAIVAGK